MCQDTSSGAAFIVGVYGSWPFDMRVSRGSTALLEVSAARDPSGEFWGVLSQEVLRCGAGGACVRAEDGRAVCCRSRAPQPRDADVELQ